jgi:hypothetical protein
MCASDKKIEVVEKTQEVEESTGFHFLEVHAPTAGMSFFAFFTFAIIGTLLFLCYRRYRRRRHSQQQQQQRAANDSFQLQQPYPRHNNLSALLLQQQQQQQQQLWNHIPWNQPQQVIYTPRIQPLDEPEQAPPRQQPQQRLNRLPPPAGVVQQPEEPQLPPGV